MTLSGHIIYLSYPIIKNTFCCVNYNNCTAAAAASDTAIVAAAAVAVLLLRMQLVLLHKLWSLGKTNWL